MTPESAGSGGLYWPAWRWEDGVGSIARFVSPQVLRGFDLLPDGGRPDGNFREVDTRLAEELFDRVAARRIRYRDEAWTPIAEGHQYVRHAAWLLNEGGGCLDISVLYAAMCLECGVAPLIAMTDRHAFVLVGPGLAEQRWGWRFALDGAREFQPGVLNVEDPGPLRSLLSRGDLIAVDCAVATFPEASFAEARRSADAHCEPGLHLVDVVFQHDDQRLLPHPPPDAWPAVRRYLPGGTAPGRLFAAQWDCARRLEGGSGRVAIVADAGRGKSTVGRTLVERAPGGAGWFLDASDPTTLQTELSAAELAQLGRSGEAAVEADREEYAQAALVRLERATTPWVVVLDNAGDEPGAIERLTPRPSAPGQLVVVTTTEGVWGSVAGVRLQPLGPVGDDEVADVLGRSGLTELVRGRALLLPALRRLIQGEGVGADEILARARDAAFLGDELAGPAAIYDVLRARRWFGGAHARLCALAAHLPPDGTPREQLEALSGGTPGTVERLAGCGFLELDDRSGRVRMHRLFGAAVRLRLEAEEASAGGLLDDLALALATDPPALRLLERRGDLPTVQRIAGHLARMHDRLGPADPRLAGALLAMASILEVRGDTDGSEKVHARAVRDLDESRAEYRRRRADYLLSRARTVNQRHADDGPRLRKALDWTREGYELVAPIDGHDAAGRFLAMQGLLLKQLSKHPAAGETAADVLARSIVLLEEAHRLRVARGADETERARSLFNLGGVRVLFAQEEPAAAAGHLDAAEQVYRQVADIRRTIYETSVHPHIAACLNGLALVAYYRALLVAATPADRTRSLREATEHSVDALRQWDVIDGAADGFEVGKANRLLAKIALARHVLPRAPDRAAGAVRDLAAAVLNEAARELEAS